VTELREGEYISRVTLGQLASHTSGLLPTHHPPWPNYRYSLSDFLRVLNTWTPSEGQEPGKQHIYTHAGYVLLQRALERRFATPIAQLMEQQLFKPLGLSSTSIPKRGTDGRAQLTPEFMPRAVQGYSSGGDPIGTPGDQQGPVLACRCFSCPILQWSSSAWCLSALEPFSPRRLRRVL
jgi:beta-lactamase class C